MQEDGNQMTREEEVQHEYEVDNPSNPAINATNTDKQSGINVKVGSSGDSGQSVFVTPQTQKRGRQRNVGTGEKSTQLLSDAVNILQTTAGRLCAPNTSKNSEVEAFCTYLASKMCNYTPVTRQKLQHAIFNLLVEADCGTGQFSSPVPHNNFPPSHSYQSSFPVIIPSFPPYSSSPSQGDGPSMGLLTTFHELQVPSNTYQQTSSTNSPSTNLNPISSCEEQVSPYNLSLGITSPIGSSVSQYSDEIQDYV